MQITQNLVDSFDKNKMYCAVLEYIGEGNRTTSLEYENRCFQSYRQATQLAYQQYCSAYESFKHYQKRREKEQETTTEEIYQEKEQNCLETGTLFLTTWAKELFFMEACNQNGTILYLAKDRFFDLLNLRWIDEAGSYVVPDTLIPLLAYCREEDVYFQIVTSNGEKELVPYFPYIEVRERNHIYHGSLLDVYFEQYTQKKTEEHYKSLEKTLLSTYKK